MRGAISGSTVWQAILLPLRRGHFDLISSPMWMRNHCLSRHFALSVIDWFSKLRPVLQFGPFGLEASSFFYVEQPFKD